MAKKTAGKKPKNKKWPSWARTILWLLAFILLLYAGYKNKKYVRRAYRYLSHRYIKTNFRPSDFPDGYDIHGIDLSHYQDEVDWDKLRAIDQYGDTIPFRFAFIKATEGLLIEDGMFDEHWEDAKDHNITRGAYHYFLPDRNARVQAANFISSVKLKPGDLPPVVDIEELRGKSKTELVAALTDFITELQLHYKVKPIIYSNVNFIEDYLADDFKQYPFWIAHYYRNELVADDSVQCLFWQHTDKADLLGIKGTVDANVFNGREDDFNKLLLH
jgi:lysozyme